MGKVKEIVAVAPLTDDRKDQTEKLHENDSDIPVRNDHPVVNVIESNLKPLAGH